MTDTNTDSRTAQTNAFLAALDRVLEHFWPDEERDFETADPAERAAHVFESLRTVRQFLDLNRDALFRDESYNGWSNYETWAVNLWLGNTEGVYHSWIDAARECRRHAVGHHYTRFGLSTEETARVLLADRLREQVAEDCMVGVEELAADLLNAALCEVDWREVAESFLDDLGREKRLNARRPRRLPAGD